jgi:heme A synthase
MMVYVLFADHNFQHGQRKRVNWILLTYITFILQLVLGFILYFISPYVSFQSGFMGDSLLRFYGVEHILGMLIAFHLMMIAVIKIRRQPSDKWNKTVRIYFGLALLVTLLSIPWPFRGFGTGWF